METLDVSRIESLRTSVKIIFNYGHIVDNILARGFNLSASKIIDEMKQAIRKFGDFIPHEKSEDKFYCVYFNEENELVTMPCVFEGGSRPKIIVLSIFRKDRGWLKHICQKVNFKYRKQLGKGEK